VDVRMSEIVARAKKRKRIPIYVAQQYEGGARGFKMTKRLQLKALDKAYGELRIGCVFFPDEGYKEMDVIEKALDALLAKLSEKNWGR
jgi:hypothetical protein